MEILFITRADLNPFPEENTLQRLQRIPNLYGISTTTIGDRFSACFDHRGDSTIIRLSENLQRITVAGTGPASRQAILLITEEFENDTLRLFDADYTFDIKLGPETDGKTLLSLFENS